MEEKINAWMAKNREKTVKLGLKIKEIQRDFMVVKVGGYRVQVTVPSGFEDVPCSGNVNSDCVFVALSLEEDLDENLMNILETLNEKLERVRITADCLNKVFDYIFEVFEKYKNPRKQKLVVEQQLREEKSSYLYKLVEGARLECEVALSEGSNLNGILPWCSVKLSPSLEAVVLQMDIKGIMSPNHVTKALGFCFDHALMFHLTFESSTLYTKEASSPHFFGSVDVFVKQSPALILQIGASVEKVVDGMEERLKDAIVKSCHATSMLPYGPRVLVPEFVKGFFHNHKIGPDGGDNIFVELLLALGNWLMMLRNRCVLCRNQLPPLSRLWYCDAELCLYRSEELGIGASVLYELQNSEVVDLELTLADAATRSTTRDVFEPYPAFLLKKKEIRNRSGFFGNSLSAASTISSEANFLANKNLDLLRELIDSFPPLSEMQKCSNETELILKVGIPWLQKDFKSGRINETNLFQVDYAEKIWLPYKILRYVLFTNRSSLRLLPESHRLNAGGSLYQFSVFYNSESEKNFEQRRATEGSVFAFHGSYISNWYSIIRNGLRCLSNTKYMSAGMAHGAGIYFSTDMHYSYSYATSFPLNKRGITKQYSVLALCEIFSGKKYYKGPNILVVPPQKETDVVIRYLLVFNLNPASSERLLVTEGHMMSGNTNLHEHYEQLRSQYIEEWTKGS